MQAKTLIPTPLSPQKPTPLQPLPHQQYSDPPVPAPSPDSPIKVSSTKEEKSSELEPTSDATVSTAIHAADSTDKVDAVEARVVEQTDGEGGHGEGEVVNGDACLYEAEPVDEHISSPHITAFYSAEIDEIKIESEVRFVLGQLISQLLQAHGDEDEYIIEDVRTSNGHNSDRDLQKEEAPVNPDIVQSEPPPPISTFQSPSPTSTDINSTAPLTVDTSPSAVAVVVGDRKVASEEEEEEEQPITPPPMGASVPLSPTSATSTAGAAKNGTTLFVPTEVCCYYCY